MISRKEIPLIILMTFTLIYSVIGNPNSQIWSGLYFVVNYLTQLMLFQQQRNPLIRKIGISLSISILIYVVIKFFTNTEITRFYTFVPFIICLIGMLLIEKKRWEN